jgi:6-phosphogluconolactonase (cycloisomerase 2 family)
MMCLFLAVFSLTGLDIVTRASAAPDTPSGVLTYVEAEFNEPGLDGPRSIAVSPSGYAVYVTGFNDDSLAVFYRIDGGGLRLGDVARDEVDGVDGLNGASAVVIDSMGLHTYVASSIDNAVAVFTYSQTDGSLLYLQSLKDGSGGVDGLYGACSLVISPDEKHVYVTGYTESAVAIFSRNAVTGLLTYVGMVQDGVGGVDGLHGARSIDISADGDHVYVASNVDNAVAVFSRNSTTGALTFVEAEKDGLGGVNYLSGASSVAVRGSKVYVVGKADQAVTVFDRNDSSGELTYLTVAREGVMNVNGLSEPISVAVSPDGLHAYATGSADDALVMMQYVGGSWNMLFYKGAMRDGVGGVDGLNYAYAVTVSPDGKYVYATGEIDDAVVIFERDTVTGLLTYVDMVDYVGGLAGPKAVAVSPDGRHVYTVSDNVPGVEGSNAIAAFGRASTGRLDFVQSLQDGIDGVHGLADAQSLAISPDGKHVYTTSFEDDAVGIFGRNSTTGELTYLGMVQEGMGDPPIEGLTGANGIAVSPDGGHVYVTGWIDDTLVTLNRNKDTGALTWAGTQKDGVFGVDGLLGASGVAASPDGKNVYVASNLDDAVAVFEWDSVMGLPVLGYVEMEKNLVGGVAGMDGATSVAVSPDGEHVYVTSVEDHALVDFARDWQHGELSYFTARWDDNGGVDGLDTPFSVAVHPFTQDIFVAGYGESALAVFERDSVTGQPVYLGMEKDEVNGVYGLGGVFAVTVSPDGRHVYAAGTTAQALVVFDRGFYRIHLPLVLNNVHN